MDVYWLEQNEADVPSESDWLSAGEILHLSALRFPKRRADWRLGRWTAKCALAACQNLPHHSGVLARIEVHPAPCGAPEAFFGGKPAPVTISLSHRCGVALCAVARPGVKLGCDLEAIEPHSDGFVSDYFTGEEQQLVARTLAADRSRLLALLWSGKESALKALREGLRMDTRCVIVSRDHGSSDLNGWSRLHVFHTAGHSFHGWWRHADGLVRTLVADPSPAPPVRLPFPEYCRDQMASCA